MLNKTWILHKQMKLTFIYIQISILLYILWDDWLIFMISGSNERLQQQSEYTLLNPDCHSWEISKIQSGREDTLEEWYAKKNSVLNF